MEEKTNPAVKHGIGLLLAKILLGAAAAVIAMFLMRILGAGELLVAFFIGLVPGAAERSAKKLLAGAILALLGYTVGAFVGGLAAKSFSGVPLGHWAVTGAFVGMTAGMAGYREQRVFSRVGGIISGFILGGLFGSMGDIGGFFTVPLHNLGLFYYMREVSLVCAGIFINLGAALGSMTAAFVDRRLRRPAAAVQEANA